MGDQRGLTLCLGVLVAAAAAVGCRDSREDERKLLQTQDRARARQERIDKLRVLSAQGELLPSEAKRAGIVLPRGFEERSSHPHEWRYEGQYPLTKVQAYFERRLNYVKVGKTEVGDLEYLGAREKSDPNATAAVLRMSEASDDSGSTTIVLSEPGPAPPPQPVMTEEQIKQLMAERRRTAR